MSQKDNQITAQEFQLRSVQIKRIVELVPVLLQHLETNRQDKTSQAAIACLTTQYSYELLVDCINVGISRYFQYDENGKLTEESVAEFLNKLGGIAFNKSKSPIDKEILHLNNCGNARFYYWINVGLLK